jgi:hypothetical protein
MILLPGPGIFAVSGAVSLQEPVVESPLPGGLSVVVRFLFGLPQWLQIAGAALGAIAGLIVLVLVWRHRRSLWAWFTTRSRPMKVGLAGAAGLAVLVGAGGGAYGFHYIETDNGFCTGCHVMGPSYQRFTQSEHAQLRCHDCHQQSMFASMRQLYLWVAERPAEIGEHAKVATAVCARCHVTGEPEVWRRIASTAGHRTHLESQAPALAGVQCVTCHATEVHHFAPLDKTCAQAGCHDGAVIALGEMRGQTAMHCTTCHRFTADVPALATRDSAAGVLVPGERQCFSCHQMRDRVAGMDMDPSRDPHGGTCGMCHNPHRQQQAAAAKVSCASAGCHSDWRKVPFHTGLQHRTPSQDCTLCHLPHQARVDPSDCSGCHQAVRERSQGRVRPPLPFDTSRARREVSHRPDRDPPPKGKGDAPPPSGGLAAVTQPDTFPHDRHQQLACLTCHASRTGHGRLTFVPPRGCQLCHHDAPATSDCARCHQAGERAAVRTLVVPIAVGERPARERSVDFAHATHGALRCLECHQVPVTLQPGAAVRECRACHEPHHAAGRPCAACHAGAQPRAAHAALPDAHVACDECHTESIVALLMPDRSLCLTCHAEQREHQPGAECSSCHLLASPEEFRAYLRQVP